MSSLGHIQKTPPRQCEMCGEVEELRPYGPRGENVCFRCAMRDEEAARRAFRGTVLGENNA